MAGSAESGSGAGVTDLPPVRDCAGHVVWRVRLASVEERTCLDCGETTLEDYCLRCADEQEMSHQGSIQAGRVVRTVDYLREREYERTG